MIVKELLLNALSNAGHIHEGDTAEADELSLALRFFNFELRRLSNKNLVTAFQKVFDIKEAKEEQVIGSITMKRGKRLVKVLKDKSVEKPSVSGLVRNRDFIYVIDNSGTLYPDKHWLTIASNGQTWAYVDDDVVPCEVLPDVVCEDMERIVVAMFKNSYNQWEKLRFVPIAQFYMENDDYIYSTSQCGENKVKMFVPRGLEGKEIKIVYNSAMNFGKFDVIDLPDAHLNLMEIATTVAILNKDSDSDPARLNNYSRQLDKLEGDIAANSVSERVIKRQECDPLDSLRSGSFIFGRRR